MMYIWKMEEYKKEKSLNYKGAFAHFNVRCCRQVIFLLSPSRSLWKMGVCIISNNLQGKTAELLSLFVECGTEIHHLRQTTTHFENISITNYLQADIKSLFFPIQAGPIKPQSRWVVMILVLSPSQKMGWKSVVVWRWWTWITARATTHIPKYVPCLGNRLLCVKHLTFKNNSITPMGVASLPLAWLVVCSYGSTCGHLLRLVTVLCPTSQLEAGLHQI